MRGEPLSTCEKNFILDGLASNLRLDNRTREEFRPVKLVVGSECGTALCTMGSTKVFCAVSATLSEPTRSRPQQGMVVVDVDMSPMGNPVNEHNRLGEHGMELTRLLELVLRDSRCIDVESLCVRAQKEVWRLRVDVRVLDDDGSLLDCASAAAVTALHHFRRPNVTVEAHHTIIHSEWEKALVPLNIYHMPICVTFGFTNEGQTVLVDPTDKEQQCISGCLVVACNKRKEVCALHQSTNLILSTSTIESCIRRAMQRAVDMSELVSTVIQDDSQKRAKYTKPAGFETTITADLLTCRESNPNELIAPALEIASTEAQDKDKKQLNTASSIVINDNPLGSGGSLLDDEAEEKALAGQVEMIANTVDRVQIQETAAAPSATTNNRQRELDEAADLLDGLDDLDDLEGEAMELAPPQQTDEVDLMAALKRKK